MQPIAALRQSSFELWRLAAGSVFGSGGSFAGGARSRDLSFSPFTAARQDFFWHFGIFAFFACSQKEALPHRLVPNQDQDDQIGPGMEHERKKEEKFMGLCKVAAQDDVVVQRRRQREAAGCSRLAWREDKNEQQTLAARCKLGEGWHPPRLGTTPLLLAPLLLKHSNSSSTAL